MDTQHLVVVSFSHGITSFQRPVALNKVEHISRKPTGIRAQKPQFFIIISSIFVNFIADLERMARLFPFAMALPAEMLSGIGVLAPVSFMISDC